MTTSTETDTRPYTYTFEISREALDVIRACQGHVQKLGQYYGENSKQHRDAQTSLLYQLAHLFASPFSQTTRITKDGELSLYTASGIHFGIIFHADRRHCTKDGCHAVANDNGHVWTYMNNDPICEDGNHEWSYPLDAPAPGTWSFHS